MQGKELNFRFARLLVIAVIQHEAAKHVLRGVPFPRAAINRRKKQFDVLPAGGGAAAIVLFLAAQIAFVIDRFQQRPKYSRRRLSPKGVSRARDVRLESLEAR